MSEWITNEEKEIKIDKPCDIAQTRTSIQAEVDITDLNKENWDYYGDYKNNARGLLTGGLYCYLIYEGFIRKLIGKGETAVPPTDAVVNVNLMPYARYADFRGLATLFDTIRFPPSGKLDGNISLYRIEDVMHAESTLGTFKRYDANEYQQAGGKFNWRKETKLQQYPYSYIEFNDHVSTPLMIEPSSFQHGASNTQALCVRQYLNHLGMYQLYVAGYKGDPEGLNEGVITQDLSLPVTSDAYMDYMARNQAQFKNTRLRAEAGAGMAVASGIAGLFSADIGGNVGNAITGVINSGFDVNASFAQERDLKTSPATLKNTGGDTLYNVQASDKKMYLYRYRLNDIECERLGWYFHMFGYKQNKVMVPNLKSRKRYNYIKTIQANLKTNGIPREHANTLTSIFNKGVTIWHIDNGITVKDYSMDNEEV